MSSTFQDTFRRHLEFEKRYSPHTLEAYLNDVGTFFSFCAGTYEISDPAEVRHIHIRSWIVDLLENGLTPRSVNRKLSSLRTLFRFLRKHGQVTHDPMAKVQPPKSGKPLPTVIDEKSLAQLQFLPDMPEEFSAARDLIVLELLYGLGLRQAELLSMEVNDMDMRKGQVRVIGKRKKERIIPFGPKLAELVKRYLAVRAPVAPAGESALILTDAGKPAYPKYIYRIVHQYLSAVTTVAKRSPHVLRHSYATHMIEAGAGIEAVKELLGHASLAATQVYTHTSVERLKKTYRAAHPKA